jgi:hypothetical protein
MLLSFLSTSKFEAAQNEAESEHDGELRRASRLNNAKRLIKADLYPIGGYPVRYSETKHAEVAKRTFRVSAAGHAGDFPVSHMLLPDLCSFSWCHADSS